MTWNLLEGAKGRYPFSMVCGCVPQSSCGSIFVLLFGLGVLLLHGYNGFPYISLSRLCFSSLSMAPVSAFRVSGLGFRV